MLFDSLSIQTTKTANKYENDVNSYLHEKFGLNQHDLNMFLAILKSSRLQAIDLKAVRQSV